MFIPTSDGVKIAKKHGIPHPAIMAHRGASYYAPEETKPSFLLAKEIGADYLELDLQETKDGILVAIHDQFLDRISNIESVYPDYKKKPGKGFTYAQHQKLDVNTHYKY